MMAFTVGCITVRHTVRHTGGRSISSAAGNSLDFKNLRRLILLSAVANGKRGLSREFSVTFSLQHRSLVYSSPHKEL